MRARWLIALTIALVACAEEPDAVQLLIDFEGSVAPEAVTVEIATSRTAPPEWEVCEPVLGALDVDDGWPLSVDVEQGAEFDEAVAFRVVGEWPSNATAVIGVVIWPREGLKERTVMLVDCDSEDCVRNHRASGPVADCACIENDVPRVFDDSSFWVEGASCASD